MVVIILVKYGKPHRVSGGNLNCFRFPFPLILQNSHFNLNNSAGCLNNADFFGPVKFAIKNPKKTPATKKTAATKTEVKNFFFLFFSPSGVVGGAFVLKRVFLSRIL